MLKKITMVIGLSFAIYSAPSYAGLEELKEKVRPFIVKVLGEEKANSILGEDPGLVELPVIPKVNRSALDETVFNEKKDEKEKNIPADMKRKLDYFFVEELYTSTRNVKGNKDELGRWFSIISQGGTREGVYRALVLDDTYRGLENYENTASDGVVEFASFFYPKFLNKSIKKEALQKFNFYTLKRLTASNSLEVVDEYLKGNKEDLYKWYAVFSGELAQRYPKAWKNKLRANTKMSHHKKWAATVPDQHIKSEIILKINLVYNFLK